MPLAVARNHVRCLSLSLSASGCLSPFLRVCPFRRLALNVRFMECPRIIHGGKLLNGPTWVYINYGSPLHKVRQTRLGLMRRLTNYILFRIGI